MAITSIDKLMGRTFFVPSYQRGYRWGRQEVEALLNDLWEFYLQTKEKKDEEERENLLEENKNLFYCLQPVVLYKDKDEQEKLIQSSLLNDAVMAELIPYVVKGHTEKELNAIARELYKKHGASDVSFDPITAYGRGAADPHHETDDTKGKRGDCVLLDIGGVLDNYISDMTRTVFLGEVSERHKEIYQIVRDANLRGIAMAKPGNRMCDVDLACRNYIEEKGFGKYFTHRTGHSAGIEDHEVGDVSSVNEEVIEVGQCFSVEPGIYIPEENIGVRVEDLVLITEDGCMVLNHYPKDLLVVKEDGTTEVAE